MRGKKKKKENLLLLTNKITIYNTFIGQVDMTERSETQLVKVNACFYQ